MAYTAPYIIVNYLSDGYYLFTTNGSHILATSSFTAYIGSTRCVFRLLSIFFCEYSQKHNRMHPTNTCICLGCCSWNIFQTQRQWVAFLGGHFWEINGLNQSVATRHRGCLSMMSLLRNSSNVVVKEIHALNSEYSSYKTHSQR